MRLPEDDPAAMSDICLLLHGEEVESLSSTATSKRILSYAIAVDKYHCLKALRLYSQGILLAWLDRNQKQTDEGAAEARIAAAAYLLEHRRTFSLTTERLMQQWNWPLYLQPKHQGRDYFDEELMQALPLNALCKSLFPLHHAVVKLC